MRLGQLQYRHVVCRWAACAAPLLLLAGCITGLTEGSGASWRSLGTFQARIGALQLPDTIRRLDTLAVDLMAAPDTGICPSFMGLDVVRDSTHLELTVWMQARAWIGFGPPPPCAPGLVRYVAPPPFALGWFAVRGHQPDGAVVGDSVLVQPS